jgi:hypothetical protein
MNERHQTERCFCVLCDGKEFWRLRDRRRHGCPLTLAGLIEEEAEQTKNCDDPGGEAEEPDDLDFDLVAGPGGEAEESDDLDDPAFEFDWSCYDADADPDFNPDDGSDADSGGDSSTDPEVEDEVDAIINIQPGEHPTQLDDFRGKMRIWVVRHLARHSKHFESWASFEDMLDIDASIFKEQVPIELSELIPATKYHALKSVNHLLDEVEQVHACVKDHYIFTDSDVDVCQVQGCVEKRFQVTAGGGTAARRVMYHWSLAERLEKMWGDEKVAEFMHWAFHQKKERGDDMKDFLDGKAFKEIMQPMFGDSPHHIAGIFCCDGVEARKKGASRSIVPIVIKFLCLPPWLQTKAGFMFIWGFPPPNCKVPIYLKYFAERCHELALFGLECWDAFQQKQCVSRFFLMLSTNDLKAKVKVVYGADVGSIRHCCSHCDIVGIYVPGLSKTIYPGAICHLPPLHETKLAMLRLLGVDMPAYTRQHQHEAGLYLLDFVYVWFP